MPVEREAKFPRDHNWPTRAAADGFALEDFRGRNVGVVLGHVSSHLTDVDLDSDAAVALAPYFLLETVTFGRASNPRSHYLYTCEGVRSAQLWFGEGADRELVEIRSTNAASDKCSHQTVFPGSTHPSGEPIEWTEGQSAATPPATIGAGDLFWRVARLAVASAILQGWVEGSGRHAKSLGLAGALLKAGWTAGEVRHALGAVRACAGDTADNEADFGHDVETTIAAHAAGTDVTGIGTLKASGTITEALARDIERHAKTPETRARDEQLSRTRMGGHLREAMIAEAREVDCGTAARDRIASDAQKRDAAKEAEATLPKAERFKRLGRVADLSKPPKPPAYICKQLGLAPGKISTVSGYAGTSKGPVLALLALCLAKGVAFLGMAVVRCRVVLWDFETGPLAETRLHRIAKGLGVDLVELQAEGWLVLIHATPPLTFAHLDEVRALATRDADGRRAIDVIIFDSYTSAVPGDQNAAEYSYAAFQLGAISNETGVTVIGAFHEKKTSQGRRGGSDLEMQSGHNSLTAAQQATVTLLKPKDDDPTLIEVRCARAPEGGFKPFRFRWEDMPAPEGKDTLGSRMKHGEGGLRAVLVAAPASPVDDTSAQETSDLEAKHARAIVKYLTALPGRVMTAIIKDVSGFEPALKRLTLAMAEEGILTAHSKPLEEGKTLTTYSVAQPNPGNAQARMRRGLHLTGVK